MKKFLLGLAIFFSFSIFIGPIHTYAYERNERIPLEDFRIIGDENYVRILALFDQENKFSTQILSPLAKLIVTLEPTDFKSVLDKKLDRIKGKNLVESVSFLERIAKNNSSQSQIIISAKGPFEIIEMQENQISSGKWQLMIALKKVSEINNDKFKNSDSIVGKVAIPVMKPKPLASLEKSSATTTETQEKVIQRNFRVVLDPGHGGIDSGAKSVDGILEKNVTLAFARVLKKALERQKNIDVFLTRDSDVFLRLKERVEKARALHADLFISIHADSIDVPTIRGSTIYTLSDKASDEMARKLAESENKVDLIDGLPADEAPEVTDILIDLMRRETHVFSVEFANKLIKNFSTKKINLIKNPHRSAGFQVLKAADIPSVLIELGYLSNKKDEKLVTDPSWMTSAADAISSAVEKFAQKRQESNKNLRR